MGFCGYEVLPETIVAVVSGSRNEEIYSKYAEGIRKIGIRAEGNSN
jgi:hypothetical protein